MNARKLPSGNYRAQAYLGVDQNGKTIVESYTALTKREAEAMALKRQEDYKKEKNKKAEDFTLREATRKYIDSNEVRLSPATYRGYNTILRCYYNDIGDIKIGDLTSINLQEHINKCLEGAPDRRRLSVKTCKNMYGLISGVLRYYRPGWKPIVKFKKEKRKDIYVPDEEEAANICKLAYGTEVYIPALLATQCGLRASEISGLELDTVYPTYIKIVQARVRGEDSDVLKDPKSVSGFRKIPIDKNIYNAIISHAVDNRVCPYSSDNISRYWREFRKKNKLNEALNFHALRHHFASKCLLLGIPQKYITELMGHKDTELIERIYQHIFPSAMDEFSQKLRQHTTDFLDPIQAAGNV